MAGEARRARVGQSEGIEAMAASLNDYWGESPMIRGIERHSPNVNADNYVPGEHTSKEPRSDTMAGGGGMAGAPGGPLTSFPLRTSVGVKPQRGPSKAGNIKALKGLDR